MSVTLPARDARRTRRREAILAVAAGCFLETGYLGTSMSTVAARLGGSKTTLWSYFSSKEDLFDAVLDRETRDLNLKVGEDLRDGGHGGAGQVADNGAVTAALQAFARTLLEKLTSPSAVALHRLVLWESVRAPEVAAIYHRRGPGHVLARLTAYLDAAIRDGRLSPSDPETAAAQLIGLSLSGIYQRLVLGLAQTPDSETIERDAAAAVTAFLDGYAAR